jgi:hypothetical protein
MIYLDEGGCGCFGTDAVFFIGGGGDTHNIMSSRTSQGTHFVFMTTTNLFGETVAVCCSNHTEHTDILCGQNAVYKNPVRTSQETHYVSATKPNRLMLFGCLL